MILHNVQCLHLQKYERPPNVFTIQAKHQFSNRESGHVRTKSATLPRNNHSKTTSNHVGSQPKRVHDDSSHATVKNHRGHESNRLSHSPSKTDILREHVNTLQNSTTKASMRAVNPPQLNNEPGIVDGYLENVRDFPERKCNFHGNSEFEIMFISILFSTEFRSIKNSITKCAYRDDNNSPKIDTIFDRISETYSWRFNT